MEILGLLGFLFFLYFIFLSSTKDTEIAVAGDFEHKIQQPIEIKDELLSTTAIGKEMGISQKEIIQFFIEKGLMARISNKLKVTSFGKQFGGSYRKRGSDTWVVWPKAIIKQSFFKNINLHRSNNVKVYSNKKINSKLENKILHFGIYHPYHGGHNPQFNTFSRHILDLKSDRNNGIDYFFKQLNNVDFDTTEAIVIVPSHSPHNSSSTVRRLAQRLAKHKGWIDATGSIVRTREIDKLSQGGDRSISVHINSLSVKDKRSLDGKNVLVLDDVTTSGNSLYATMKLLRQSNVKSVWSYAVAKTA